MATERDSNGTALMDRQGDLPVSFGVAFADAADPMDKAFIDSVPADKKRDATKALIDFNRATQKLLDEETRFNARARWEGGLTLTEYLRSETHVTAEQDFRSQADSIVALNGEAGKQLVERAEKLVAQAGNTQDAAGPRTPGRKRGAAHTA